MKYFIHLPMNMEPIVSSETSTIRTQTPGNYPKRNKLHKKSVRGSNPHLSFNRPLPTRQTDSVISDDGESDEK